MTGQTYQSLDDLLHKCIHCGLCLPVCPTYNLTFSEQSSPRGRIRLMKSVQEGSLPVSREFVDEMYFCLDCQACQTACPAGVQYGQLVEDARQLIRERRQEPYAFRLGKSLFLAILASKRLLKFVSALLRWYQRSGMFEAVDQSRILTLWSEDLQARHALLPKIADHAFDNAGSRNIPLSSVPKGRVAFLSGCVMNEVLPEVHRHAVEVLRANGYEVLIPPDQGCCGSLHGHNGATEEARTLARRNIDVFMSLDCDALVVDSAGCSAFLKEYGTLLADDSAYAAKAMMLAGKTKEISEFLVERGFIVPTRSAKYRVTYHDACHLVHTQKISLPPRAIIQAIPGIEFVELPESTWCCGSAGIYNVVRYEDSMEILSRKMDNLLQTSAAIVATSNPGCHLQLQFGIRQRGMRAQVMHPVSLLFHAYRESGIL